MKHLTENTLMMLKSKTYVTTRAHHRGKELLDNHGVVILVGSSGTGKTTLGLHLMAHIRDIKNRQVLMLDYPSQFEDVHIPNKLTDVTEEEKLVILIDDIFGRSNFVYEYLQKWEKTFSRLWDIVKTGFIKVILTCRSQIFCECENSLNQFDVFKKCHQINLHNPDFCLTIDEKLSILDQHLKSSISKDLNNTLSNSDKEMIAESTSSELGFPQCCSFFVNSPDAQKRGVNYFKNPIEYLKAELCNIKENKQCHFQYLVLLIIMFKQGTLDEKCMDPFENDRDLLNLIISLKDVCRINTDVSLGEIKASAKSLCGVYLAFEESNKQYTFIHQSVFDTLFLLFSSEFLHKSIQICPVSMLLEYVVTPHVQTKGSINVLVEEKNYSSLAERFTKELKGTHVDDDDTKSKIMRTLLLHPSFKDEYFMKFLTEEFWNNEVPTELLCQQYNVSEYITVRFSQNVIDNLWKIVENGKHDDLDLLDIMDYIPPEQPIYKICTFSSLGSMAVLKNIKTLSRCFLSSLCKINTSETERIKKGIFDVACFMGNTEVIDILLNSGIFPTMCSLTNAVASQTDDLDIFTNLFKLKNDLKLNLHDLGSMLFLALEQENGKISSFLIDEIIGMDNSRIILENAAKQLLLQCHRGVWNLWNIYSSKGSFKMRAGNLFRKLFSYTQSLKLEVLVALTTDLDAGAVLKEIIGTNPSCLETIKCKVDPLLTTSRNGCIQSVAFLIEQGCNISAVTQQQYTSLHLAVEYNTYDVVLCLLSNGADPNAQDINGNSPLHLAVQQEHLCLIKALVKYGANINIANKSGESSLHIASKKCSLELIKYLVEGGAQVNSPDICGRIPLHLAAIYNYSADCVKYLLEKGSKVNWPDDEGLTPLLLAPGTGVASSLLDKGADHLVTDGKKNTVLHRAVHVESKVDSLDLAKLFVTKGVKMNAINADGDTPIHIALKNNKSQIVTYLVDQGCLINMTGEDMTTLLYLALNGGFVELVKTLIQKGANLNTTDDLGMNPLHTAIENTDNTIMFVKYLVGHGSSVNIKNRGSAPLHLALNVKKFDVCLYLLNEGADPNDTDTEQNTPLHLAAHNNSVDVLKTLLQKGAIVNAVNITGRTPLHMATEEGSLELAKTLVQNGANLNKTDNYGWTPLLNAIKNKYNSSRVLDYLMECIKKQSVNWEDSNLMHLSSQYSMHLDMHMDIVNLKIRITQGHLALIDNMLDLCSYLLHRGADPNASDTKQNSPLHLAVHEKSQDVVETLIANGANVNAVNSIGKTALHIATEGYSLVESLTIEGLGPTLNLPDFATIKILIEKGAKLNVVDVSGNTPLHNVAQYSPVDVVKYLVEKGSQIHLPNDKGMMPIHLAVQYNTSDVCLYLLQKGADPNVEDANGKSPLYLAIYNRYLNLVETLLEPEHGVHLNKLDDDGNTPLHFAAKTSSLEIVSFLIEMGSETNLSNDNGVLPFHLAVKYNTEDVALYLLDKTTKSNLVGNIELDSPLHMAAKQHSLNLVKALVERGANVNEVNEFGKIPLHSIIQSFAGPEYSRKIRNYKMLSKEITGSLTLPVNTAVNTVDSDDRTPSQIIASYSVEGVKYLVQSGSHINTSDDRGRTPLHLALRYLFPDVSVYLLEHGADPCVKDENETPPLHLAANNKYCSLQLLKALFKKGANLNSTDPFGNTPLHIVVEQNSVECVEYLVEKGSQINKANNTGTVPLHTAVGLSDSTIGLYLLSKGADPKITSAEKMSPLHLAARTNHLDLVHVLIIKGANLNAVDNSGETALHKAVCCNQLKVVHYLVEEGSLINVTNSFGRTALHLAALHNGKSNVGVYLLSKGSEPNVSDSIMTTPLHLAVHTNTLDLIKALVENGANPNAVDQSRNTPLHIAVQYSPLETVSCLVEKGSKINLQNNDGMTPIHLAAQHTTPDISLYLLDKGANVNVRDIKGKSPLHIAVHESKVDLVKALVENKAKLNTVDTFRNTPLHIAAHRSTLEIVRSLVDKGSEVNLKNSSNLLPLNLAVEHNTSEDVSMCLLNKMCDTYLQDTVWMDSLLHLAAKQSYLDLAKALVDKGANVNARGESGKTTLHIVVENKSLEFVKYLVAKEAKVNAADEFKCTPLHIAVLNNSLEIVTCLTENTADVNVRTRENMTPLYIAVKQNHYDISLLLLSKGADPNIRDNNINDSPLHLAAKALSFELLKALVENKANVNDTDINGNIPLHTIIDGSVKATYSTAYYTDTNSELSADDTTCLLNSTHDSQDSTQELPKDIPGNALKCVRYLVKNDSDVNIANAIGATPLHLAVKHNMFLVSSYLLSKGADPNVNNKHNTSPLHLAAEKCCSHVLEELVGKGANVNARDMLGNTPLHIGVKSNSTHAVMYLVENGSEINLKNNQSLTPLHLATSLKTPYWAIYLLGKGADPNVNDDDEISPLHLAVDADFLDLVKALVERGARQTTVDSHGHTPFQRAVYNGSFEIVCYLGEKDCRIDSPDILGRTPLHLAACGRRIHHPASFDKRVIRWLLDAGCGLDSEDNHGYTPLMYACASRKRGTVEQLLEYGANPRHRNYAALYIAVCCNMPDILKCLLNKGGNVKAVSDSGDTLLHVTIRSKRHISSKLLPFIRGSAPIEYWTLLIDTLMNYNMEGMTWATKLLSYNFPVPQKLRWNCQRENVFEVLLNNGCNINVKNKKGQTALHVCIECYIQENLVELLNRGADVSLVDNLGKSALYYAVSSVMPDAVQILLQFGAKDGETSYGEKARVKMQYTDDENVKAKCSMIIDILDSSKRMTSINRL